ncbi:MAG: lipoprotein-releasing ABC transporter permease subunit [Kordiimonadaceae bacterium]|nr:lipoprotein-releasing ABC transporter permease subunit [Kordiimonadaceae bacterium]
MLAKGFEWGVAKRYLLRPPSDGFISLNTILSIVAIALGVTALIAVMSVMNGFRAGLIESILGHQGHAVVYGYNHKIPDYEALVERLRTVDGVVKVRPYVEAQVMATKNGQSVGGIVRGLPPKHLSAEGMKDIAILRGSIEGLDEKGGIIIGYALARRLGVGVGDTITIVSPNTVSTPFGSTLRYLAFPVEAIVEIGLIQFDESFIGMPLELAQRFFRAGDTVSNIEVFLDDPENIDGALPQFDEIIGRSAVVRGWRSFNPALLGALQTERVAMFLILSLIILVAVFNVSSSLVMMVKEKSGDIAILRTMGATQSSIRRIFLIVGLTIGSIGIIAGGIMASLIVTYIEQIKNFVEWITGMTMWDPATRWISEIRADVNPTEVSITILVAMLLSFFATIIPAIRASRLDPVAILRHE